MKRFSQQFYTKASSVKLQTAEARELRARVVSYMEYHPMTQGAQKQALSKKPKLIMSPYKVVTIPTGFLLRLSGAVATLVIIVIPLLADQALPGDNLYAVKVRFNEEVQSTLIFNPYEKVEWETERLNRRIAEAKLLASEGKLTGEVESEVVAAVREHTETIQREIEEIRESDADGAVLASIELSTTLSLQSDSLLGDGSTTLALAMTSVDQSNSTQKVADVINESLSKQETTVENSEIPAYDKIMARVEVNTTRAYELLNTLKLDASSQLYKDIDRRLQDVNRSIELSNTKRSQDEAAANQNLIATLERTQKLIVLMSSVEFGESVDIAAAVPIMLTEEEQKDQIAMRVGDIDRKVQTLESLTPQMSPQLAAKVGQSTELASQTKAKISETKDLPAMQTLSQEALAYLDDALVLVTAEGITLSTPVASTTAIEIATSTEATPEEEVE
jgi:tetrahydromethanopterin S-methyltransferase subunit G